MATQNEDVLDYIGRHGGITTKDAYDHLGITALRARIHDLREEGYAIVSERVPVPTRRGTTHVKRYRFDACRGCRRPLDGKGGENASGLCPECLLESRCTVGGEEEAVSGQPSALSIQQEANSGNRERSAVEIAREIAASRAGGVRQAKLW